MLTDAERAVTLRAFNGLPMDFIAIEVVAGTTEIRVSVDVVHPHTEPPQYITVEYQVVPLQQVADNLVAGWDGKCTVWLWRKDVKEEWESNKFDADATAK
jgi:hypothetical protein